MPFQSKAQERAAFAGGLGKKMQDAAPEWAAQTNQQTLPITVKKPSVRDGLLKKMRGLK